MAIYEIENNQLKIRVESFGAELKSLMNKRNKTEYLWSGDPSFWPRTSPVLFPFVGRLKGLEYIYDGKTYPAPVHGFARDTEFDLVNSTENSLTFEIKDTDRTREIYPFSFVFQICFRLEDNSLKVQYDVRNTGEKEMYFSLGGHPGFNCPLPGKAEKRADCYIGFRGKTKPDKIKCRDIDLKTGLAKDSFTEYELEDGMLKIQDDMFKNDALVLEEQINQVTLSGKDRKPYLTFRMDAPVYGIWSCVRPGAPFVCIEPWFGRCDRINYDGAFEKREYQNKLSAGEEFKKEYKIIIENQ